MFRRVRAPVSTHGWCHYHRRVDSAPGPLTHVDETGAARMVDVSGKEPVVRGAVATGVLRTTEEVVRLLRAEQLRRIWCRCATRSR